MYQADDTSIDNFEEKMAGAMLVLRNRLDSKGFTEGTVTRQGTDRIRVEIPINDTSDIQDPNEISKFIGSPAKLEFLGPNGELIMEGADIANAGLTTDGTGKPAVGSS